MPFDQLAAEVRFVAGLPRYLRHIQTFDEACRMIRARAQTRSDQFLRLVRRSVFEQRSSPYKMLFKYAGCEYGDLAAELRTTDLEDVLRRLKAAGVWVSFEEYKGRAPIVRGGAVQETTPASFENHALVGGLAAQTGGSSGTPSRALVDLDFLADRATYDHLMFAMLDLRDVPFALWYSKLPASQPLVQCLRYAKIGRPPAEWFDMAIGGNFVPQRHRLALTAIMAASRVSSLPIPWPKKAPIANPGVILDWLQSTRATHGRVALQSTVSGILRVSQYAIDRAIPLTGVQFIVGSEPLTAARHRAIEASGARVYGRYHSRDVGTIGQQCGHASEPGDLHLASDTVVLLQPDHAPGDAAPFYLTQLIESCPRVLINVEMGDAGIVSTASCGCLWETFGLTTHVTSVRSYRRSSAEGLSLPYAELSRLVEDILPAKFGGTMLHYQWVEQDMDDGFTRLRLRIDPIVGPIDPAAVQRSVIDALRGRKGEHGFFAQMMDRSDTIQIVREPPRMSAAGKSPAVMRLEQ